MKKWMRLLLITLCTFWLLLVMIKIMFTEPDGWFANIFTYKLYAFGLSPLYLAWAAVIGRYLSVYTAVRIGSRKKALAFAIICKVVCALVYTCFFIASVNIFAIFWFPDIFRRNIWEIFGYFCSYFLGFTLMGLLAEIFSHAQNRLLSENACFCSLVFVIMELVALDSILFESGMPNLDRTFIFSCVFWKNIQGYIMLAVWIALSLIYLFKVSRKADYL